MSEFSDKIKDQLEKANEQFEKVLTAGRGLLVKVREESDKQYKELVQLGETKGEENLLDEYKSFVTESIKAEQLKLASVGLFTKVKSDGESFFNELVELGKSDSDKEAPAS